MAMLQPDASSAYAAAPQPAPAMGENAMTTSMSHEMTNSKQSEQLEQILANSLGDMTFHAIANLSGTGPCIRR